MALAGLHPPGKNPCLNCVSFAHDAPSRGACNQPYSNFARVSKHRIDIDLSSAGWLAFALVAIPLLVLAFFFLWALVVLIALMVLVAVVRAYWLRHKPGARGPTGKVPPGRLPPP